MARRKRKTVSNLEKQLAAERRSARTAREKLKSYKEGLKDGLDIAKGGL